MGFCEHKCWQATCDGCGDLLDVVFSVEDDEMVSIGIVTEENTEAQIGQVAMYAGWVVTGGKLLCPDCVTIGRDIDIEDIGEDDEEQEQTK